MEIVKEMRVGDVLAIAPQTAEIFMGFGMSCFACPVGEDETIEEAAMVHGIDLDELLKMLNEKVNEENKENKGGK